MRMKTALAVVGLGLFLVLTGCGFFHQDELPAEMYGVWRTSAPGYEDRFLQLRKGFVVFGVGNEKAVAQHIRTVKALQVGPETLYTVSSEEVGGDASEMNFYYNPAHGGSIRFKNQEDLVWKKEGGPAD